MVNDYRAAFGPLVEDLRRSLWRMKALLVAGGVIGMASTYLQIPLWVGLPPILACFALSFYYALRTDRCPCPACTKNILHAGSFCPVCATPIDHSQGFFGPTCSGCGHCIRITRSDHRKYRIHHCPHCAALLSDEGL